MTNHMTLPFPSRNDIRNDVTPAASPPSSTALLTPNSNRFSMADWLIADTPSPMSNRPFTGKTHLTLADLPNFNARSDSPFTALTSPESDFSKNLFNMPKNLFNMPTEGTTQVPSQGETDDVLSDLSTISKNIMMRIWF